MTIFFAIVAVVLLGLLLVVLFTNNRLEKAVTRGDEEIVALKKQAEADRQNYESEAVRVRDEAEATVAAARQKLNQQAIELEQEAKRLQEHYESEAARVRDEAQSTVAAGQQKLNQQALAAC